MDGPSASSLDMTFSIDVCNRRPNAAAINCCNNNNNNNYNNNTIEFQSLTNKQLRRSMRFPKRVICINKYDLDKWDTYTGVVAYW